MKNLWRYTKRDKYLLLMMLPGIAYFIVFQYLPLYGIIIAFKDFSVGKGITGSPWITPLFKHFDQFFGSYYFGRLIRNTFLISVYSLVWGFPLPIIFALALNELKPGLFKKTIQTISYMPHFISTVVVAGLMINVLSPSNGLVNNIIASLGGKRIAFLQETSWFRSIYVGSGVWQGFGWGSIIYLAALSGIDPQLYEAAKLDGAGRWKQMWHISLPGISNTIIILLIMNLGNMLRVGYEKLILLYSTSVYEVGDVISTYVYRSGLLDKQYSFASAVGLFNSVVSLVLLITFNRLSKKVSEVSIW
jgi:putative aldouronate transport system permease protein